MGAENSVSTKFVEHSKSFIDRVQSKDIIIGIVGLGYVGLPLAKTFIDQGFKVVGFDVDETKITQLNAKQSYIKHIGVDAISAMMNSGLFSVTTNFEGMKDVDAILICVPTPLTKQREPDLSYVDATTEVIAKHLRPGQIIILESTTYPGTSTEILKPILEKNGLKSGEDFAIAYSPEREDPGNPNFDTASIPKVVGASTTAELDMACAMYGAIVPQVVPVTDLGTAEAVKLTENIFRAVNIALVNELKVIYQAMGIDVWEVIDAAATKPFGYMPFYPGPGLGGHCIPIDPFYLTWKARGFGLNTRFIELAGEINTRMPSYVISQTALVMSDHSGKALRGSKILLVGLAYKKNVDDLRESPALEILELLRARGVDVQYYDPYIPVAPSLREHPEITGMKSVEWNAETLATFDAAIIVTDHDQVDYDQLAQSVEFVIDTRNAIKTPRDNVYKA